MQCPTRVGNHRATVTHELPTWRRQSDERRNSDGLRHARGPLAAHDATGQVELHRLPRRGELDPPALVVQVGDAAALPPPPPSTTSTRCSPSAATGCRWATPTSRSRPPTAPSRPGPARRTPRRRLVRPQEGPARSLRQLRAADARGSWPRGSSTTRATTGCAPCSDRGRAAQRVQRPPLTDYAIVAADDVDDFYAGSDVPGEFRRLTDALGSEQVAVTLIRVPPHSDFEQGTGHYHDEIEELYIVTRGHADHALRRRGRARSRAGRRCASPRGRRARTATRATSPSSCGRSRASSRRVDATKIDDFWEASPAAAQRRGGG